MVGRQRGISSAADVRHFSSARAFLRLMRFQALRTHVRLSHACSAPVCACRSMKEQESVIAPESHFKLEVRR